MPFDDYYNFLAFFSAVTIYSSNYYKKYLPLAKSLSEHFVENFSELYPDHLTSNPHNFIHVGDEVERFAPLPTIPAYPFETTLYEIKFKLRNGRFPLIQIANRYWEITESTFV